MTPGVAALGVGVVLFGVAVTIAVWGGPDQPERLLGRTSLVAILGGVALGLLAMGVHAVLHGG